jgi:hypothetical protein|tara:strand:- start:2112 stop:2696 length:585 start_codon:yes stop_codon:yes gene_type:complete
MGKKYLAGVTHKVGSRGTIKQKTSWAQLGMVFGGHLNVTPDEAAEVLTKHLFKDTTWKGNYENPLGRMWRDVEVVNEFQHALSDREKLIKKYGTMKATRQWFYYSGSFFRFTLFGNIVYEKNESGFKRFQNDFAIWKKLPFFKARFQKKKKLAAISDKKLRKKVKEKMLTFEENQRRLIEQGYEQTSLGWRKIQ